MLKKWTFLCSLILMMGLYSCNCTCHDSEKITNHQDEDLTVTSTVETPPVVETTILDATTLDGFWTIFQKAVADQNIKTLESLYSPDAHAYKFNSDDYQKRIAKGVASDIEETQGMSENAKTYVFSMEFPHEGEEDWIEASNTSIYIEKNTDGLFRILAVIEAG